MTCQPIQPRHLLTKLCNIFFQQGRHVTSSGSIWLKSRREEANLKPQVLRRNALVVIQLRTQGIITHCFRLTLTVSTFRCVRLVDVTFNFIIFAWIWLAVCHEEKTPSACTNPYRQFGGVEVIFLLPNKMGDVSVMTVPSLAISVLETEVTTLVTGMVSTYYALCIFFLAFSTLSW